MESVGPVEIGNSQPLPDFPSLEQTSPFLRLVDLVESSQTFACYPQPVEKRALLLANPLINACIARMKLIPELVGRLLPWFMPPTIHKPPHRLFQTLRHAGHSLAS